MEETIDIPYQECIHCETAYLVCVEQINDNGGRCCTNCFHPLPPAQQ